MAKDSSFDVVCETDMQEVSNAVNNTKKALAQRYDLKDSGATIEVDRSAAAIVIAAPSDFVASQIRDVLDGQLVKRGVDLASVSWGAPTDASGGTVRVTGDIISGIDQATAKNISSEVRAGKFKVKVSIEGDKLRISGPKKDELQSVIAFLRERDWGIPLKYVNYR